MPDVAQVQIVNTALGLLGQEPVIDLGEASLQGSIAATKLMRVIEQARDTVLRRHGWICALKYVTLPPALIDGYVNWRYPTVYVLDADALRLWELEGVTPTAGSAFDPNCWGPRWQAGTEETDSGSRQVVRAQNQAADGSSPSINIAYVRRCGWSSLDATVADAIAYETASRGALSVTGMQAMSDKMTARAENKVMQAISVGDTQEGGQPSWMPSIPAQLRNLSR